MICLKSDHFLFAVIDKEYTTCMQRLFKYPPVEDVSMFISKALTIMNPKPVSKMRSDSLTTAQVEESLPVIASSHHATASPPASTAPKATTTKANKDLKASDKNPLSPGKERHTIAATLKSLMPEPRPSKKALGVSPYPVDGSQYFYPLNSCHAPFLSSF